MRDYLNSSKMVKSVRLRMLRLEERDLSNNSAGKKTIPSRFGASDLTIRDPTLLSTSPREFST